LLLSCYVLPETPFTGGEFREQEPSSPDTVIALDQKGAHMTTTVLSEDSAATVSDETDHGFRWSAVIAGAAVASATAFFLVMLGAGFGLTLMPRNGGGTFLTLGAIYVLAAQAFGFAAGGHVAGRLIGPALETRRQEEWRAGLHGLVMWAITVVVGLAVLALVAAGGGPRLHGDSPRNDSAIAAYWSDLLLAPMGPHEETRGQDLEQDKQEAARVLLADLHPGNPAHGPNHDDLVRLTAKDAGGAYDAAVQRVDFIEAQMRQELDMARKVAGYAGLWAALALLFGAVLSVAAAISAGWEDDKLGFSMARRY
jgi:hypothetical protein